MEESYTKENKHISKVFSGFFDIIECLVYAVAVVVVIFLFFGRLSMVDGASMNNTLAHGDYLVVTNPLFLYQPQNNDIVVVHGDFSGSAYDKPIVKRVIASGGQWVEINLYEDTLSVDGVLKEENYIIAVDNYGYEVSKEAYVNYHVARYLHGEYNNEIKLNAESGIITFKVPENHYFVMGDNRLHSADSRIADIGFVHKDYIVGKAFFRLLPFDKFGGL